MFEFIIVVYKIMLFSFFLVTVYKVVGCDKRVNESTSLNHCDKTTCCRIRRLYVCLLLFDSSYPFIYQLTKRKRLRINNTT